jgi:hypothetical protein
MNSPRPTTAGLFHCLHFGHSALTEVRYDQMMQRPFPADPQHWRLRAEEARACAELIGDSKSRVRCWKSLINMNRSQRAPKTEWEKLRSNSQLRQYGAVASFAENDGFDCGL